MSRQTYARVCHNYGTVLGTSKDEDERVLRLQARIQTFNYADGPQPGSKGFMVAGHPLPLAWGLRVNSILGSGSEGGTATYATARWEESGTIF
jgi:hypothetical protein